MPNQWRENYKLITDTLTAAGIVVLAATLVIIIKGNVLEENKARLERLDRTFGVLNTAHQIEDEKQQKDSIRLFEHRWDPQITQPLPREKAELFYDVAIKPDSGKHEEWNVARKHLNAVETLAFAYMHEIGDQKIIAASECASMTKSYQFFKSLIEVFGEKLGPTQSWQIIPQAVTDMNVRYPQECGKPQSS